MSSIKPKSKRIIISGPSNARHVGGIKVTGTDDPGVYRYFAPATLEPDELPSHTFTAIGKTELPQKSNNFVEKLRGPSLILVRSLTRSNSTPTSHVPLAHRRSQSEQIPERKMAVVDRITTPPKTNPSIATSQSHSVRAERRLFVRPRRADSGTAIDFDDIPVEDRPMGFKEIMEVSDLEQRMALYKKARDYWASANHGLEQWTGKYYGNRTQVSLLNK